MCYRHRRPRVAAIVEALHHRTLYPLFQLKPQTIKIAMPHRRTSPNHNQWTHHVLFRQSWPGCGSSQRRTPPVRADFEIDDADEGSWFHDSWCSVFKVQESNVWVQWERTKWGFFFFFFNKYFNIKLSKYKIKNVLKLIMFRMV